MKLTVYKVTRFDSTDFYSGRVLYKEGKTVIENNSAPSGAGCCKPGLHVSKKIQEALTYINPTVRGLHVRIFQCEIDKHDILDMEYDKMRVRKLFVVREIPLAEVFPVLYGLYGRINDLKRSVEEWKKINWGKSCSLSDDQIKSLFDLWQRNVYESLKLEELKSNVLITHDKNFGTPFEVNIKHQFARTILDTIDTIRLLITCGVLDSIPFDEELKSLKVSYYNSIGFSLNQQADYGPYHIFFYEVMWKLYIPSEHNLWTPLTEMYLNRAIPIGYRIVDNQLYFVVYAPNKDLT